MDLAKSFLEFTAPELVQAEAGLSVVERECKDILKRGRGRRKPAKLGRGVKDDRESNGEGVNIPGERLEVTAEGPEEIVEAPWLEEVKEIRIEALKTLVDIEEGLGREGRAKRWRALIIELERGQSGECTSL